MPHIPEDTDPKSWHRYFAIESNNQAWELAAKPSRSEAETQELLNLAHASALHWGIAGTDAHAARAKYLVAEAHALAGFGEYAKSLMDEVMAFFDVDSLDDWEAAFIYTIYAHAMSLVGTDEQKVDTYQQAETAVSSIADPEERKIVDYTFVQVPAPEV